MFGLASKVPRYQVMWTSEDTITFRRKRYGQNWQTLVTCLPGISVVEAMENEKDDYWWKVWISRPCDQFPYGLASVDDDEVSPLTGHVDLKEIGLDRWCDIALENNEAALSD